jgi:sialic acid synthase SpsE
MLVAAQGMGADGIKFQLFRSELLVVRDHPGRSDFDQIELSEAEWRRVLRAARESGLALFVEAFDRPSLELAAAEGADAYKVHTTDMENPDFIKAVAETGKPVWFATGGVPEDAVEDAVAATDGATVGLLHGFQTFPTPIEEIRFRELATWKERYGVPVGFLDHTDGGSTFALVAPALSVCWGADLVEKHFTLDRSERGYDYHSSLDPGDFARMVELLREAESAVGDGSGADSAAAQGYHRTMARHIVAGAPLAGGTVVQMDLLAFKRTDPQVPAGLAPREAGRLIGRTAKRPIDADEIIREEMLE